MLCRKACKTIIKSKQNQKQYVKNKITLIGNSIIIKTDFKIEIQNI